MDRASSASLEGTSSNYVKVTLVFWIAPTHVELEFLYITFQSHFALPQQVRTRELRLETILLPSPRDCNDFTFDDARVRDKLSIFTSESIVLDNPAFFWEARQ